MTDVFLDSLISEDALELRIICSKEIRLAYSQTKDSENPIIRLAKNVMADIESNI